MARRLASDLNAKVGANIYMTPLGSRGLVPHYDDHDVFVIQCEGNKTWQIFDDLYQLCEVTT